MNNERQHITSAELVELMKKNDAIILDVRSVAEFEDGHIWNSLHRPVDTLPNSVRDLSKEASLITVCNKGHGRSESAANLLREAGWTNARWLENGYLGWVEAGLPDYEPGFTSS